MRDNQLTGTLDFGNVREFVQGLPQDKVEEYLAFAFPRCVNHLRQRSEQFGTTWTMEPVTRLAVFQFAQDKPDVLDYVLCHVDPKANEELTLERLAEVVTPEFSSQPLMEVSLYLDNTGIEKKFDIYRK
jgi:hypothetical protein